MRRSAILALSVLFLALLGARLCHLHIVWIEEAYPASAALQMLYGKTLYRDIWFDKPPLSAAVYLLWGAHDGLPLRLAGTIFVFFCCCAVFAFARQAWSEREGLIAAALLGFTLTFGLPAAVMALAPDLLMILPHTLAVYFAWRGRAFLSGLLAGTALLVNPKGLFVLLACALWIAGRQLPLLALGFALPVASAFAYYGEPYWQQVWQWGAVYSSQTFSFSTAFLRTFNWTGFQAALVLGAAFFLWRERKWRWLAWVLLSFAAVCAGWRFFPRYYFQLLPPLVLMCARAFTLLGKRRAAILSALLLVPLIRFGPRYVQLAAALARHTEPQWSDLALEQDSRAAAALLSPPGSLLVWGYRPDQFVFSRLPAATRFLDSQPLTGVLADRHLTTAQSAAPALAARNRQELLGASPDWIADGLGPLNPALAITQFSDLRPWLDHYTVVARTPFTVIYRRKQ